KAVRRCDLSESCDVFAQIHYTIQRNYVFLFCFKVLLLFLLLVWISNGDIILIGLRDYQDNKADVIMKYLNDEARTLKSLGTFVFFCLFSFLYGIFCKLFSQNQMSSFSEVKIFLCEIAPSF
ncbi:unnamed protein product, partial [Trichobilharzia regenti]